MHMHRGKTTGDPSENVDFYRPERKVLNSACTLILDYQPPEP